MTDSTAFHQHITLIIQLVAFHHLLIGTHGFRAGLHDKQLPRMTIFGPLDIHWAAIMFFNQQRLMGQCFYFIITESETIALYFWHIFNTHLLAMLLVLGVYHPNFFGPHIAPHDGRFTVTQCGFVYIELIRVNCPLYHHFSQTMRCGDKDHLIKTRLGINREHHARRRQIRTHHPLYAGRQCYAAVVVPLMHTIRNSPVIKQ